MNRLTRFVKHNSLTLAFGTGFLLTLAGQAISGHADFNNQLVTDGLQPIGFLPYLTTSDFAVDVTENWQSEYLQFFLYVFGTAWLLQRGSPESKGLHKAGVESDVEQKVGDHAAPSSPRWAADTGWRQKLYSRSLGTVMAAIFAWPWLAQSITGAAAYSGPRQPKRSSTPSPASADGSLAQDTSGKLQGLVRQETPDVVLDGWKVWQAAVYPIDVPRLTDLGFEPSHRNLRTGGRP